MTTRTYTAYTDGACINNGSINAQAGWGAVIYSPEGSTLEIAGPLTEQRQTNQRAELMAAIKAVEAITKPGNINLYSDSQYVVKGATEWMPKWKLNNWRNSAKQAVENQDLWKALDALLSKRQLAFYWVKGHSGHPENNRADALASEAATSRKTFRGSVPAPI